MNCKFSKIKECIHAELFDRWSDDKVQTAYLTLDVCPNCRIYNVDWSDEEVKNAVTKPSKEST